LDIFIYLQIFIFADISLFAKASSAVHLLGLERQRQRAQTAQRDSTEKKEQGSRGELCSYSVVSFLKWPLNKASCKELVQGTGSA
jgi:hypothetical protein